MNRSLRLGVLMLFVSTVTQSPVPVVSGTSTILEVLAVALAEGCCVWALAVPIANDETRLKASRPLVMFLVMIFFFMFFSFVVSHLELSFCHRSRAQRF